MFSFYSYSEEEAGLAPPLFITRDDRKKKKSSAASSREPVEALVPPGLEENVYLVWALMSETASHS